MVFSKATSELFSKYHQLPAGYTPPPKFRRTSNNERASLDVPLSPAMSSGANFGHFNKREEFDSVLSKIQKLKIGTTTELQRDVPTHDELSQEYSEEQESSQEYDELSKENDEILLSPARGAKRALPYFQKLKSSIDQNRTNAQKVKKDCASA